MTSAEISFALVALPGAPFRMFRDNGAGSLRSRDVFVAVPWNTSFDKGYVIRDTDCPLTPGLDGFGTAPLTQSTDREEYLRQLATLISTLKATGGKTVVSAVICGSFAGPSEVTMDRLVQFLHDAPSDCYRCLFHTPRTGTWLIVSPETLADIELDGGRLRTMSLAGSRPAGTGGAWDRKNRDEQAMVTGFILDCLKTHGVSEITTATGTRRASAVEHIITEIEGRTDDGYDCFGLLDSLSPTPALCGLPRDVSLRRIAEIERHPRRMYGGYTAVIESGKRIYAAVTLRCAHIDSGSWCIYTGSGITGASDPEAEWSEISLKARPLTDLFLYEPITATR